MALVFFNPLFFKETRAEDFCQLFIVISLYNFLLLINKKNSDNNLKKIFLSFGICIAATLLIKFTIAIMLFIFIPLAIYVSLKNKQPKVLFLYVFGGFILITLPFIIYFLIIGNIGDFFREYFVSTYDTVKLPFSQLIKSYIAEWKSLLIKNYRFIYIIYFLGTVLFCHKLQKNSFFISLICLWFLAIAIRHDNWNYYINVCSSFAIFGLIFVSNI